MIYRHTLENLFNMRPEWLNERIAVILQNIDDMPTIAIINESALKDE